MKYTLIPLAAIVLLSVSCNKNEGSDGNATTEMKVMPYALDTCIVSGEKLGSMGEPVVIQQASPRRSIEALRMISFSSLLTL